MSSAHQGPASTPDAHGHTVFARRGAPVHAGPPVAAGSSGRFEIQPELAILTSNILGSESSTTLVERERRRLVQQIPSLGETASGGEKGRMSLGEG
jgi:hypothetical protein